MFIVIISKKILLPLKMSKIIGKNLMKVALDQKQFTDCLFVFPNEMKDGVRVELAAHKMFLCLASPVFKVMFCNKNFIDPTTSLVVIYDSTSRIFKLMLDYIYTGEVEINEIEDAHCLFLVAQKYDIAGLVEISDHYSLNLIDSLTSRNVFSILNFGYEYENTKVNAAAWKFIRENTEEILNSKGFLCLELNKVIKIFMDDELTLNNELQLFIALEKYANNYNIDRQDSSGRLLLLALKKIRFLTMSVLDFFDIPMKSRLLTEGEKLRIACSLVHPSVDAYKMPKGFSCEKSSRITGIIKKEIMGKLRVIFCTPADTAPRLLRLRNDIKQALNGNACVGRDELKKCVEKYLKIDFDLIWPDVENERIQKILDSNAPELEKLFIEFIMKNQIYVELIAHINLDELLNDK